ncbi:hypothetical protein LOAG_14123, partial [Loa loa]
MMLQRIMVDLDKENDIHIRYRIGGSSFNLWRQTAHTKTTNHSVRELIFVCDEAFVAHKETALQ